LIGNTPYRSNFVAIEEGGDRKLSNNLSSHD
jgi:hypothetical protein